MTEYKYNGFRARRGGFKWTINEVLSLQREYELLSLSIEDIAVKHSRTPYAILTKLKSEGFITSREFANRYTEFRSRSFHSQNLSSDLDVYSASAADDFDYDDSVVSDRIGLLEHAVNEIRSTMSKLVSRVYGTSGGVSLNSY
jgi:hypothetical protein